MSQDGDADPRIGQTLQDRYRIEEALSSGAMGSVYRAERVGLGRKVAIKFLHPHFAQQPDFIKRFEHEALAMSKLNHPNCISVIDFGVEESPFIVMDYVSGHTLADVLGEGPLPVRRAVDITRQILAGLAHAHAQGIIHRDVKPANIMLTAAIGAGEHVHILDFGLAKLRDADLSMSGIVVGTPSYMSPEQAAYKKLDGRSDLYSTGVLLFELLTGRKPFRADEAFDIIRLHLDEPPPRLRDVTAKAEFPDALEEVTARALSKSPDERFPSAMEFSDALAEVMGEAPPAARAETLERARGPGGSPAPELAAIVVASGDELDVRTREGAASAGGSGRLVLALAAACALGWALFGAPGLPAGWLEQASAAARGLFGASAETRAGGAEAQVESLDDARALAAQGDVGAALRGLHELRRQRPGDGEVLALIGELYAARGWRDEALAAFGEAVAAEPSMRGRAEVIDRVIEALGDRSTRQSARVLLIRHFGEPALPHLREAAGAAGERGGADEILEVIGEIELRAQGIE
jgi:eukaryotic-like serine/threonine-protein kinase